jgi:hypothetical protein
MSGDGMRFAKLAQVRDPEKEILFFDNRGWVVPGDTPQ